MSNPEKPSPAVPLAMVICQSVAREEESKNYFLNRLFSAVASADLPVVMDFFVYACVTGLHRKLNFRFNVYDSEDNIIAQSPVTIVDKPLDPTVEVTIVRKFSVDFPSFGHFFVRLLANGEYIMERRLTVAPSEPTASEDAA